MHLIIGLCNDAPARGNVSSPTSADGGKKNDTCKTVALQHVKHLKSGEILGLIGF